ncbi:DUF1445 domain-containing protein [Streptomyces sp. NPDC005507]|uniref:D-glutamate cyclase family protein n=1 Tax=unclassified Streptomyces TaxID=2593676 RepID=UPI0033BA230C
MRALRSLPPGYTQATVVILPRAHAADFHAYCLRNAKACGLLWMSAPGQSDIGPLAPGGDIRSELHRYRVWRGGVHEETVADIAHLWRDDLVTFYLGCSLTFEQALDSAGVQRRAGRMYSTTLPTHPVGAFDTHLSVTMPAMTPANAIRAIQVTGRFPATHGAPVHFGDPAAIGIKDLSQPDFGPPAELADGEVPVFWACSATAVSAAEAAAPDLLITFDPPYMLVTDRLVEETSVF